MSKGELLKLDNGGPCHNRAKVLKRISNTITEYESIYTRDPKTLDRYALTISEVSELLKMDIYTAIADAYQMGFIRGARYQKKQ